MKILLHKSLSADTVKEYLNFQKPQKGTVVNIIEDCVVIEPDDLDEANLLGIESDDYVTLFLSDFDKSKN